DWRCGGTWLVGLEALPNLADGSVSGLPLTGSALRAAHDLVPVSTWHKAQLSVVRPGYPQRSAAENDAAFGFRLRRDAAHVDGLHAEGPQKRRHIREPHAFILGLALTEADQGASPLVAWEGSHLLMGAAFKGAAQGADPAALAEIDVTRAYQAARKEVFDRCTRHVLHLPVGGAVLLHRHLLHGVSPWQAGSHAPPEGRAMAYFRPEFPDIARWIAAP
ncbi:MAG: hypothetical protein ORN49_00725, partial [Rhodobacteraceae bacterium]|nr:hypothetical protein [Paracoccaceae bacterium]